MCTAPDFGQFRTFFVMVETVEILCGKEAYHIMNEFAECSAMLHRHALWRPDGDRDRKRKAEAHIRHALALNLV